MKPTATLDREAKVVKDLTDRAERKMRPAPMPQMAAFVKLQIGVPVQGIMREARCEIEKVKLKKGKKIEKERYYFRLELTEDATLLTGPKKATKETLFKAGQMVTLPEHGFLTSAMRRIACELEGKPFNDEEDTHLKVLEAHYFEIVRQEDREITKGDYKGTASAIYDVQYDPELTPAVV